MSEEPEAQDEPVDGTPESEPERSEGRVGPEGPEDPADHADEGRGPGPGSEPRPSAERGANRTVAVLAGLIGLVLILILALLATRCGSSGSGTDEVASDSEAGDGSTPRLPEHAPPLELRGTVLRELPLDHAEGAIQTPSGKPRPTDDPELDALLAELEPTVLSPPLPGTCRVRAWQGSQMVGPDVECDSEGNYTLPLVAGTTGAAQVELLIDDHLRGLIEIDEAELDPNRSDPVVMVTTVALGIGSRVAGQTIDARGDPLPGVRVQALPQPNLGELVPWRTTSDAEGRFEFTTLPYGPVNLRGIRDGYALSVVEALAPEDAVLMVLDELIDLEGSVVGDPELIARAEVRLEGSSVWPAIEIEIDPDGGFVFEDLPDGVYGVEVLVPADTPGGQEYASVPLENITPDLRVAVALVPAFRVPVRVVDPDGEPVAGARVTLGNSQIGMLQKVAETDEEGRVAVGPGVPGPYFLHADADGFLAPEPIELEIRPEGFTDGEQVLVLIRPAKLEGVVVDEDDRPVPGADVWLDSEVAYSVGEEASRRQLHAVATGATEGSLGVTRGQVPDIPLFLADGSEDGEGGVLGSVVTDENGHFEIDLLLPGTHRIWATHGGHAASAIERFELRSGELRGGLRLRLREGVPLTGVVRSANGQPLAGVQVDLGDGLVLTTDERGVFDAGHRRGRQTLILRGAGLIPKQVEVDLGSGGGTAKTRPVPVDLELELEPAEARFEGRVVDGNDQPIADVEVELRPLDGLSPAQLTWTDARGVYEFVQLAPGPVEIGFEHRDYVAAEARVRVDDSGGLGHEIVLDTGWSVPLFVRSVGRGDPIVGATVRAGPASRPVVTTTNEDGRARLDRLIGETVKVEISAPDWVTQTLSLRRSRDEGELERIVELVEAGSISGTLDDDIGEPVANAMVEVRTRSGTVLGAARTNGRGEWLIEGIRPGDVVVHAEPPTALSAVLAPVDVDSDVREAEVTTAVRLRFDKL